MTKANNTRRALVLSILSIFLCFTMLMGTTYAWFTDEVTSATNQIVAGNLDVELTHTNKTVTDKTVEGETALFTDVTPGYWEPNAMAIETFNVKNLGNLALKYKLSLNVTDATKGKDNTTSFASVLKVASIKGTVATRAEVEALGDGIWKPFDSFHEVGDLLATAQGGTPDVDTWTFIVWWEPSNNDNNFNMNNGATGEMKATFGVKLVATQLNSESDSFDSTYDINAEYNENTATPTPPVLYVNTAAELKAALTPTISTDQATVILNNDITLADGETWTPLDLEAYTGTVRNIVIDGQGHFIAGLDAPLIGNCYFGNTSVEIKNLTLKDSAIVDKYYNGMGSGAFIAYADNSKSVIFDNCHLEDSTITATGSFTGIGGLIGYSSSPLTITDCSVTNCTITGAQNSAGAIAGHVSAGYTTNITNAKVVDCTVKGQRADKTGYVVGTANNGATVITTSNDCANNTVFDVANSTTIYGRLVGGTLTVNGVAQ